MSEIIAATLAELLELEQVQFDNEGCFVHTLPSNQEVHLRWLEDESALLVALPFGSFSSDLRDERAYLLLIANQTIYVTGGGGLGFDQESQQVFLSRYFPVNLNAPNMREALGALMPFCLSGEVARGYFDTVNILNAGEDGLVAPGISADDVVKAYEQLVDEEGEQPPEAPEPYIAEFSNFLGEALKSVSIDFAGLDEDAAFYLQTDDEQLMAQIRLDTLTGEVLMTCVLGEYPDDSVVDHALELLGENLFLEATGNCVLGLSDGDTTTATLSLAFPMESLMPDATMMGNLVTGFLQNAAVYSESLDERISGSSSEPMPPPTFQQFV